MQNAAQQVSAFKLLRKQTIPSLNLDVEEYEHQATGAMHYHLAADNPENVFLVAFRTVPQDSTGVAHILEHTTLCGSEKYPVRDPFFMMIRRSLNTFMNAFTSADWTAYPFASENRKDFQNLLEVYLDAAFFSRLDPLDFAQEGHRLEFSEPDNPDSELLYKGVVFNEMKGAMSSVPSQLWQAMSHHLFPSNTYHFNSGGDPAEIPNLSYEDLVAFYKTHYHPSNAIFMTFGDIPAAEHQARFEELALHRFSRLDTIIEVPDEQRYASPQRATEYYPVNDAEKIDDKHHVVMGWLLGHSTNLEETLEAHLLTDVLLDNSASPLRQVLETTALGNSPSPLCGLEDSLKEVVFVCGLEGCKQESVEAIEQLILSTLERVAEDGVPHERLESVLNQLELEQREISGDGFPYGLQLLVTALGSATHRGDPINLLDMEPAIAAIRARIEDPDYIRNLARRLLLDNPHRVTLHMAPDTTLAEKRAQAEKDRLQAIRESLTPEQITIIVERARALQARQQSEEDESILPKVGLEDIAPDIPEIPFSEFEVDRLPGTWYSRGTNGLVYQQLVMTTPELTPELAALLPCYTSVLTEVGLGEADYLQTQTRQAAVCGSISAFSNFRGGVDDEQALSGYTVISAKALGRFHREQSELIADTLENARFDEHSRLRELIAQRRAHAENSISGNGHLLAMNAASSGLSPVARLTHETSGLQGIAALKQLHDDIQQPSRLEELSDALGAIHAAMQSSDKQMLLIAEEEARETIIRANSNLWNGLNVSGETPAFSSPPVRETTRQCWTTNTDVSFCAKAYPTVPLGHPDAAPLTVLGGFLRNGYLHRAIREQGGAYGGGASQDSNTAAFRFFSYRDPRSVETLEDFDRAVEWLLENSHNEEQLEQAILGVIGSLDKPGSPAGDAKRDFQNRLFGRSREIRQRFRQQVVGVTLSDLQRVAREYLAPEHASIAVITSAATRDANREAFAAMALDMHEV